MLTLSAECLESVSVESHGCHLNVVTCPSLALAQRSWVGPCHPSIYGWAKQSFVAPIALWEEQTI